jgi:hypothetical protein
MISIALIIFFSLTMMAALHIAWGFGAHWPAPDERALVSLVVGRTGTTRMPTRLACLRAAVAIFLAGFAAIAAVDLVQVPVSPALVTAAGVFVAAVFALRGIAAYLPVWRRAFAQEPFATLDRDWYGPFCLLLALAFALLVLKRVVA